ncbi:MAG: hypothetical protein IPP42_15265 [Saprospiraceae bacterium]|nr:hypothetical protein [Saprospiraceae bacterium]
MQEAGKKGIKLKPEAAHLLAEYLGADLGGIAQNLDKIKLSVEPEQTVSAQDLEPIIGIHKEFNVFEMQKLWASVTSIKYSKLSITSILTRSPIRW